MSISIICPTRGRKDKFYRMYDSARSTEVNYCDMWSGSNGDDTYSPLQFPIDTPTVHMWNHLCALAKDKPLNKLFMLGSDDTIFATPGWDKALLDHYNSLENKIHVYALKDSRDPEGTPHPIVTREYINAMGYFMSPIFLHWFVDTWTVEIAKANSCFTHLKDFELIHDKPSDKGQADETHNRIRRMGWHERDKHVNDKCQHFLEHEKRRLHLSILEFKNKKYSNRHVGMYEEGCA